MLNGGKFLQQQQLIWMSGSTFWNMSKEVVCRRGSVFRTAFTLLRSLPFYREIRDRVFVSTNWSFLPLFSTLLLLFPLFLSFFLSFFLCLSLRDGLKMIGPFFFFGRKEGERRCNKSCNKRGEEEENGKALHPVNQYFWIAVDQKSGRWHCSYCSGLSPLN